MNDELSEVWKVFGRDTEAGRALWRTYAAGHKKQVQYPGLKTKPWDPKEALKIEMKPCPQQTIIEYPPTFSKSDLARTKMMSQIHKIDLVQHRKPRYQILDELRKYYSVVEIPINRAVNREKIIKSDSTNIDLYKSLIYTFQAAKPKHLTFSFSSSNKSLEDTNVRLYYKNYTGTIFSFRLGNNGLIRVNQNQVLEFYNNTGLSTIGFNGVTPAAETNPKNVNWVKGDF